VKKIKCLWSGVGFNPIVGEPSPNQQIEVSELEFRILKVSGVVKEIPKEISKEITSESKQIKREGKQ